MLKSIIIIYMHDGDDDALNWLDNTAITAIVE